MNERDERPELPVSDAREARYTGDAEHVPDPRNEPSYWTVRKLMDEPRPPERVHPVQKLPMGGRRVLWAICQACTLERSVDLETVASLGHADHRVDTLRLRCKCGGYGHALLRWVNPPKPEPYTPGQPFKPPKPPRKGSFNFATGERKGAWD